MRKQPEILAPAGSMEALYAAVRSGADAVYMGGALFNARRNAKNFSPEELESAARFTRQRGVRLYLTLNTLLFDSELEDALTFARFAVSAGVDALIVADLGLAVELRKACPELPLHASTQMTVHNPAGCKSLETLGFARVVPARELSLAELAELRKSTSMELEVFIHGALCMSVSGQCYLSGLLGGRSGNRGLCAQPCRLPFELGKNPYALSLKELSAIRMLPDLARIGVNALKIEGRMRRPEYVAAAVTACRTMRDTGKLPEDIEALLEGAFSRSGFTSGYLENKRDKAMFGRRDEDNIAASAASFAPIHALYKNEYPAVGVDFALRLTPTDAKLEASDGTRMVTETGESPVIADNVEYAAGYADTARRTLEKTGGTPFYLRNLTVEAAQGLILPAAALGRLRRQALDALLEARAERSPLPFTLPAAPLLPAESHARQPYALWAKCETIQQAATLTESDVETLILPLKAAFSPEISQLQKPVLLALPELAFGQAEQAVAQQVQKAIALGFTRFYCDSLWAAQTVRACGGRWVGGAYLNITNALAAEYSRELGAEALVLSTELTLRQAQAINTLCPTGLLAYGHLPLMKLRNCPAKSMVGCVQCKGDEGLADRLGNRFPLLCADREYASLINCVPLYTAHKPEFSRMDFGILCFTKETPSQCAAILSAYRQALPPEGKFTLGSYAKGVE